jgi:hypothetical protein
VRRRLIFLFGLTALAAPAVAQARPDTIDARGSGRVLAVGDFKTQRDPTYGGAVTVFGEPARERSRFGGTACVVNWPGAGLRINFVNLGGGSACDRRLGRSQTARAYGSRWRTKRGLKVGARLERLRRLYPHASRHGRSWWLVIAVSPFGAGGRYPVLAAAVRGGHVRSFKLRIGAAGE